MLYYGTSDVGMKRQINQDNFLTIPVWGGEGTLLVVCDGMGGHKAGWLMNTMLAAAFAFSLAVAFVGAKTLATHFAFYTAFLDSRTRDNP